MECYSPIWLSKIEKGSTPCPIAKWFPPGKSKNISGTSICDVCTIHTNPVIRHVFPKDPETFPNSGNVKERVDRTKVHVHADFHIAVNRPPKLSTDAKREKEKGCSARQTAPFTSRQFVDIDSAPPHGEREYGKWKRTSQQMGNIRSPATLHKIQETNHRGPRRVPTLIHRLSHRNPNNYWI